MTTLLTLFLLSLLVFSPSHARALVGDVDSGTSAGFVDISSSTAGARVGPDAIKTGMRTYVKDNASVKVCFNYVDRGASCATALTSPDNAAYCGGPGETYVWPVDEEHFRGQVCAILESGTGPVRVKFNAW